MRHSYFRALENLTQNTQLLLPEVIDQLSFNSDGLMPVITQDAETLEVLMLAWMNKESLQKTLDKGRMIYWSRSRQEFWEKGATSGHIQELVNMSFDCDGDAILCKVIQTGAACHTGRKDCFYLKVKPDNKIEISGDPA